MKQYTLPEIKLQLAKLDIPFPQYLHVVGIRAKDHKPDAFTDNIYLIWGESVHCFTGTTIPGVHWLQNLMNKAGTAVVKADTQYPDCYALGLHKGKDALIQVGTLTVYRDNDLDNLAECIGEPVKAGPECRIDIHGTGPSIVSVVIGSWSAACQVLNNPVQYKEFIGICKKAVQKLFTYTLLNEF